jgi:hypothetical protein
LAAALLQQRKSGAGRRPVGIAWAGVVKNAAIADTSPLAARPDTYNEQEPA